MDSCPHWQHHPVHITITTPVTVAFGRRREEERGGGQRWGMGMEAAWKQQASCLCHFPAQHAFALSQALWTIKNAWRSLIMRLDANMTSVKQLQRQASPLAQDPSRPLNALSTFPYSTPNDGLLFLVALNHIHLLHPSKIGALWCESMNATL